MNINNKYYELAKWILTFILLFITLNLYIGVYSFSPTAALKKQNSLWHYGPSEIINTINLDNKKIFLCKYKDWFSANTVIKDNLLWYCENSLGTEINYSKKISYTYKMKYPNSNNKYELVFYGYVNDPNIEKIVLTFIDSNQKMEYVLNYERFFIFYTKINSKLGVLQGYDENGVLIVEADASNPY